MLLKEIISKVFCGGVLFVAFWFCFNFIYLLFLLSLLQDNQFGQRASLAMAESFFSVLLDVLSVPQ